MKGDSLKAWFLSILQKLAEDRFTGKTRVHFGRGTMQHAVRTTMLVDDSNLPVDEPADILDKWEKEARTGHIDFIMLTGCLVDIQESDTLFPPKPKPENPPENPAIWCPNCKIQMVERQDYGNMVGCSACKSKWTLREWRELTERPS